MRVQPKRLNRFWFTSFDVVWWESDPFLEMKNIGQWPWLWKGQNPPFCFDPKKFWPEFSRKRYEIERMCPWKLDRKSFMGFRMVELVWPLVTSKGQRSRSNHQNFEVEYHENRTRLRESVNRSQIGSHVWAFEWWKYVWPLLTSRGQRSRSNHEKVDVEYLGNGTI